MKPVAKYCVYEDILLTVPIYVTKCRCFSENPINYKICQIAIRRSEGPRPEWLVLFREGAWGPWASAALVAVTVAAHRRSRRPP